MCHIGCCAGIHLLFVIVIDIVHVATSLNAEPVVYFRLALNAANVRKRLSLLVTLLVSQ